MKNFKIIPSVEKKMINGKERYDFMIQVRKRNAIYFAQADSNIWWKPRKITHIDAITKSASVGWLFLQVGFCSFI